MGGGRTGMDADDTLVCEAGISRRRRWRFTLSTTISLRQPS